MIILRRAPERDHGWTVVANEQINACSVKYIAADQKDSECLEMELIDERGDFGKKNDHYCVQASPEEVVLAFLCIPPARVSELADSVLSLIEDRLRDIENSPMGHITDTASAVNGAIEIVKTALKRGAERFKNSQT